MLVKICGVTTAQMALDAAHAGANLVGLVLVDSPRRLSPERAADIARALKARAPRARSVAVFHDTPLVVIQQICDVVRPALVQVEPTPALIAAFGPRLLPVFHDTPTLSADVGAFLAALEDAREVARPLAVVEAAGRGGRGVSPDPGRVAALTDRLRVLLAGGLTPGNVREAVRRVAPYGVDVSSGVERGPGDKDPARMRAFARAARAATVSSASSPSETPSSLEVTHVRR